jgi:ABC-type ATPase with predicted acetyltransferase domain
MPISDSIPVFKSVRCAAASASARTARVAALFGLGLDDEPQTVIVPPCRIPLPSAGIVLVTGPSGGGKSTILSMMEAGCARRGRRVIRVGPSRADADADAALIDSVGPDFERACSLLALAGLSDAFAMLRRVGDLSAGQRCRFELARAMDQADRPSEPGGAHGAVLVADEFCAMLDRVTATTIASNVRRWIDRGSHTLICASSHDDLLESLRPTVLVWKRLGPRIEVRAGPPANAHAGGADASIRSA